MSDYLAIKMLSYLMFCNSVEASQGPVPRGDEIEWNQPPT